MRLSLQTQVIAAIFLVASTWSLPAWSADLKVASAQIRVKVGDFEDALRQIAEQYDRAVREGADLIIFPEGIIPGYPSADLLTEREFNRKIEPAVERVRELTRGKPTAIALGHLGFNPKSTGKPFQDLVSVFQDGKLSYRQAKVLLPTYGPFDDARYFEPGRISDIKPFELKGKKISFLICEDGWFYDPWPGGRLLYKHNPVAKAKRGKPDLVVSVSASPFHNGKMLYREKIHADVARRIGAPMIYVNQVGSVDGLVFDGNSFLAGPDGKVVDRLPGFEEAFRMYELPESRGTPVRVLGVLHDATPPKEIDQVIRAEETGLRELVEQTGHDSLVIHLGGLDRGIDSAVAMTFAARAVGPENVYVIQDAPSGDSNETNRLVRDLGIPIENILPAPNAGLPRIPGKNPMIVEDVDKTELALGSRPVIAGAADFVAPNGDLYKSDLAAIAKRINEVEGRGLVAAVVHPADEEADPILKDLVENNFTLDELRAKFRGEEALVDSVYERYRMSEIRRAVVQAPTIKVSPLRFGRDHRVPIMARRGGAPGNCLAEKAAEALW